MQEKQRPIKGMKIKMGRPVLTTSAPASGTTTAPAPSGVVTPPGTIPEARWNFDDGPTGVFVCKHKHEEGAKCVWEWMCTAEVLKCINTLRARVLELEARIRICAGGM